MSRNPIKINIIAAMSTNGAIGKDGKLPWHIPEDLAYFKQITMKRPVLMGNTTYKSIGSKPLHRRVNVVITRNKQGSKNTEYAMSYSAAYFYSDLDLALTTIYACGFNEVFVIGGESIYRQILEKYPVETIYLTVIHQYFDGDTHFPSISMENYKISSQDYHHNHNGPDFSFVRLDRIK